MGGTTEKLNSKRKWKTIKTTGEKVFLVSMPPEDCLDGQMENTTKDIGKNWRKIGNSKREWNQS